MRISRRIFTAIRTRRLLAAVLSAALLVAGAMSLRADTPAPVEIRMKAASLLSLTKYIDWPEAAFEHTNSPLVIGVFGSPGLAAEFSRISREKTSAGHPIQFTEIATAHECTTNCHILFLGPDGRRTIPAILGRLHGASVLTVSDTEGFLDEGGIVNLDWRNAAVHFAVNLPAARRARLQISSKLLNIAEVMKGNPH